MEISYSAAKVWCSSCAKDVEGALELSSTEVSWLRALISLTFDQLLEFEISPETAALLLSLAHSWCAVHLDARLRAFEFMMSV